MTREGGLQSRQERKPLFAQGRQIAANATKGLGSGQRAEAAGDLLLHFDHAQVALGLIVVKLDTQIFQKAEDGFLMFAQAIQQVAGRTLFDAPTASRWGGRSWGKLIGFLKHAQKGAFPIPHFQRIESTLALCSCLLGGLFHRQQQLFELDRPGGSVLLGLKDQLAQHMYQTERMFTVIQEVRRPAIVDANALEEGQDANGVQGLLSAAGMHLIMRQAGRTGHMLPVSLSSHPHPCFVLMKHGCLDQGFFDLLLDVRQFPGGALDQFAHRRFTHLHPQQIRQDFPRAFQWQQLLLAQIDGHRPDPRSILDGGCHRGRERGDRHLLTARTLFLFGAVFLHEQAGCWHIHHLPTQCDTGLDLAQIVLEARADGDPMLNDFIGLLAEAQGTSWVSLLPAAFLPALFAQAFGLASKAIGGGGQVTIAAVFCQPILQVFDLLAHTCTLLALMTFGKSQANLGSYHLLFRRIKIIKELKRKIALPYRHIASPLSMSILLPPANVYSCKRGIYTTATRLKRACAQIHWSTGQGKRRYKKGIASGKNVVKIRGSTEPRIYV